MGIYLCEPVEVFNEFDGLRRVLARENLPPTVSIRLYSHNNLPSLTLHSTFILLRLRVNGQK